MLIIDPARRIPLHIVVAMQYAEQHGAVCAAWSPSGDQEEDLVTLHKVEEAVSGSTPSLLYYVSRDGLRAFAVVALDILDLEILEKKSLRKFGFHRVWDRWSVWWPGSKGLR